MKILKLEFENLNSLKGHWQIDFTHPDYAKNHDIFVIHGPTGSGKTTLLDAITLALYGRTPRLEAINNGESGNEIMTRGTPFCRACVTYSCKRGIFLSEFQQSRANGKATGNLQKTSFRISKDDGEVIATGTGSNLEKETLKIIELDYKQFCRSIMLAQGEFSAFLESNGRERAEILEKLTGTERYRAIGKKIAEKFSEIKKTFQLTKKQKEEIESLILTEEAVNELKNLEKLHSERISVLEKDILSVEKKLALFDEIERLTSEKNSLSASIIHSESVLKSYEENSIRQKAKLEFEENDLINQQSVWKTVRELDVKIQGEKQKTIESKNRKTESEKLYLECENKISSLEMNIKNLEKTLSEIKTYLEENKKDENLPESIAKIETIKSVFLTSKKTASDLNAKIIYLKNQLDDLSLKIDSLSSELKNIDEKIKEVISKDALFIAKILKSQLKEGETCPVCGSSYHFEHKTELSGNEEAKAVSIMTNSSELSEKKDLLTSELLELSSKKEAVKTELKNAEENFSSVNESAESSLLKMNKIIEDWKISVSEENIDSVIAALKNQSESWKINTQKTGELDSEKISKLSEKKTLEENLSSLEENFKKANDEFETDENNLQNLNEERKSLFQEKNVDFEESKKNQVIQSIKEALSNAEKNQEQAGLEKTRLEARKEQIEKILVEKQAELNEIKNENETENAKSKEELLFIKSNILTEKQKINSSVIDIKTKLSANEQNKKSAEKLLSDYEKLQNEYGTWEQMNKWAGLREGADLSVFVQSLAFNSLLRLANKNLFGITKRYTLHQKASGSLEFDIEDVYFDSYRSISNLSGGEKFLVSLSFALGISEFASRNVRVDSLFLDEGFGTLSGELLTEAINALKNLQKKGKMLGIITHVQDVINEIDQKIEIKPSSLGNSVISGSGIQKI